MTLNMMVPNNFSFNYSARVTNTQTINMPLFSASFHKVQDNNRCEKNSFDDNQSDLSNSEFDDAGSTSSIYNAAPCSASNSCYSMFSEPESTVGDMSEDESSHSDSEEHHVQSDALPFVHPYLLQDCAKDWTLIQKDISAKEYATEPLYDLENPFGMELPALVEMMGMRRRSSELVLPQLDGLYSNEMVEAGDCEEDGVTEMDGDLELSSMGGCSASALMSVEFTEPLKDEESITWENFRDLWHKADQKSELIEWLKEALKQVRLEHLAKRRSEMEKTQKKSCKEHKNNSEALYSWECFLMCWLLENGEEISDDLMEAVRTKMPNSSNELLIESLNSAIEKGPQLLISNLPRFCKMKDIKEYDETKLSAVEGFAVNAGWSNIGAQRYDAAAKFSIPADNESPAFIAYEAEKLKLETRIKREILEKQFMKKNRRLSPRCVRAVLSKSDVPHLLEIVDGLVAAGKRADLAYDLMGLGYNLNQYELNNLWNFRLSYAEFIKKTNGKQNKWFSKVNEQVKKGTNKQRFQNKGFCQVKFKTRSPLDGTHADVMSTLRAWNTLEELLSEGVKDAVWEEATKKNVKN